MKLDQWNEENARIEEHRRLADNYLVRALAFNKSCFLSQGRVIIHGSRSEEFTSKLEKYNKVDARFGRSYAAIKLSKWFGGQ